VNDNSALKQDVNKLKADNTALKSGLTDMLTQMAELKKELGELRSAQEACCFNASQSSSSSSISSIPVNGDAPILQQNAPDPFNNNTVIRYYLPSSAKSAQLMVTNVSGQVLKYYTLSGKGTGQTTINAGELASGNYFYTLIVDGKKIATKQMVLLQ
jgi:hypothetical protein